MSIGTNLNNDQRNTITITATITSGQTDSAAIDLKGYDLVGFIMPSAMTGTSISFKVSDYDGGTYAALYNSSNALISFTTAASRAYKVTDDNLKGLRYIKLVSGSSEGANRSITLLCHKN